MRARARNRRARLIRAPELAKLEAMVLPEERPMLRARRPSLPFSDAIPRQWLHGSILGTALANSLNLLFPWGERMFIRSVHAHAGAIRDPLLLEQVRGFMAQEVRHAGEHE